MRTQPRSPSDVCGAPGRGSSVHGGHPQQSQLPGTSPLDHVGGFDRHWRQQHGQQRRHLHIRTLHQLISPGPRFQVPRTLRASDATHGVPRDGRAHAGIARFARARSATAEQRMLKAPDSQGIGGLPSAMRGGRDLDTGFALLGPAAPREARVSRPRADSIATPCDLDTPLRGYSISSVFGRSR